MARPRFVLSGLLGLLLFSACGSTGPTRVADPSRPDPGVIDRWEDAETAVQKAALMRAMVVLAASSAEEAAEAAALLQVPIADKLLPWEKLLRRRLGVPPNLLTEQRQRALARKLFLDAPVLPVRLGVRLRAADRSILYRGDDPHAVRAPKTALRAPNPRSSR